MRIEILLSPMEKRSVIPLNYNYQLSVIISKLFSESFAQFIRTIDNHGYNENQTVLQKLFTFSKLFFFHSKILENTIEAKTDAKLLFSSPLDSRISEIFINELIGKGKIEISNKNNHAGFKVMEVHAIAEPQFKEEMKYVMISPCTASYFVDHLGDKEVLFYKPDDDDLIIALKRNLMIKYEILQKKKFEGNIDIIPDKNYISKKGGGERISKKIILKEGLPDERAVIAFYCPVTVVSDVEIQKIAYNCGIGQKNYLGFGMIDVLRK